MNLTAMNDYFRGLPQNAPWQKGSAPESRFNVLGAKLDGFQAYCQYEIEQENPATPEVLEIVRDNFANFREELRQSSPVFVPSFRDILEAASNLSFQTPHLLVRLKVEYRHDTNVPKQLFIEACQVETLASYTYINGPPTIKENGMLPNIGLHLPRMTESLERDLLENLQEPGPASKKPSGLDCEEVTMIADTYGDNPSKLGLIGRQFKSLRNGLTLFERNAALVKQHGMTFVIKQTFVEIE